MARTLTIFEPICPMVQNVSKTLDPKRMDYYNYKINYINQ